jgi:putative DNA primase/helicase
LLHDIWADDAESIDTLQELFGQLLTPETKHQKIFLMVGPKRSGKGTIARVLTALLGRANVCNPTLAGIGSNFGLEPLIGKPLALIGDARLGGRSDQQVIAERLLSISGEDGLTIDRKYMAAWTGTLPTRFLILTNELPRMSDASGALAGRFIVLQMTRSFYGREDLGLSNRLLAELPGILKWALAGLDRLNARGHFVQPSAANAAIEELQDLASPVGAFLRSECVISPECSVRCDDLYESWLVWCRQEHRDAVGTKQRFFRDLRAAIPTLVTRQVRTPGRERVRECLGVGLAVPVHYQHAA